MLKDRVAIVTGGAKGMGGSVALGLAREGARLCLCARDRDALDAQVEEIRNEVPGVEAITASVDVRDENRVKAMVDEAMKTFGTMDILVNTAGVIGPVEMPVHKILVENWDYVLDVNLKGTFLCCKHVIPTFIEKRWGKIVNLAGTSGLRGYVNRAAYSSSKWAVRGFTRTLALELGPYNINVNCICPGPVSGDRMNKIITEKARVWNCSTEDVYRKYTSEMALGRFPEEEEIAAAVVYLCSEKSRNMTGQAMVIDSGWDV
ncbi:MAG: SDR family NAD(P)-dependent oxidoreductase [Nitrospinota bacterium]